ncbi:MAG: arylsulfatase [Planctomycetota bacterium]
MKTNLCILFLLGSLLLPSHSWAEAPKSAKRPNIVLVMADDLGFSDLGCYGSEIETPNLDSLAQGGLRFTQFYNTAKCHSSRICLLTGLYMFQAGNNAMDKGVTIAEALRPAGYQTLMAGKWHLAGEPTGRGFDRYFGHLSGATNFFTGDDTFRLDGEEFEVQGEEFYTTDENTDYSINFLEARDKTRPFFLYMAFNAPHYPLHVKEIDYRKYENRYGEGWDKVRASRYARQQEMGLLPGAELSPRPDDVSAWSKLSETEKNWEAERMAAYAGMVDCLDQNIGRLVGHLKETGHWENTVFIFCSDNGACPFERTRGNQFRPWDPKSYWTYDKGWAHVGNTPFRWYKQNQHEGGISSPMIVSWAGLTTEPGSICREPAHLIDLLPTCLDLGQTAYPEQYAGRTITPLQGRSLFPIFNSDPLPQHPWLYFQFSNNRAIRQGDYKLVSAKGKPWELYNLAEDRSELVNLVNKKPELAKRLKSLWQEVATEVEHAPEKLRKPISVQAKNAKPKSTPTKRGKSTKNK